MPDRSIVQSLVHEEIRRLVADAIKHPAIIASASMAALITRAYPNSGLTPTEIENAINQAAVQAGVALELSKRSRANVA